MLTFRGKNSVLIDREIDAVSRKNKSLCDGESNNQVTTSLKKTIFQTELEHYSLQISFRSLNIPEIYRANRLRIIMTFKYSLD